MWLELWGGAEAVVVRPRQDCLLVSPQLESLLGEAARDLHRVLGAEAVCLEERREVGAVSQVVGRREAEGP